MKRVVSDRKERYITMRSKSHELMDRIQKFAEEYYLDNGHSPAASAIAAELNISRATAYRYLVEMNDRGMVEYDGQEIHTTVTKKLNSEINRTAIVGSVPCGSPQYEEENIKEYIYHFRQRFLARESSLS